MPVKFHKILEYPKDKKGNSTPGQFILAIAVLLMGIILSLYYFHSVKSHVNSDLNNKFSHQIHLTTSILDLKLEQYTNLVSGGEGLFNIGAVSSQQQWLSYFQTYNLLKQYPGVVAVSYSQYVNQSELPSFVSQAQTEVTPSYKVYPAGTRPIYAPVKYIAYVFPQSQRTYGYDVLTNPQRAAAVNKAMVSGKPIMSGKISLKSTDIGKPAFVIYAPVYSKPSSTLAERRQNIEGFVFVATSASGLINNVMAQLQNNAFAFEIYDGNNTSKASSLMYKSNNFDATYDNHLRQKALPFIFDGHEWSIQAVASKALLPSSETQSPAYTLMAGIIISFILAFLVWYSVAYRERKLIRQKQVELQLAKDDLLALASHQLRTPATVVKQYLGILLQNYGGDISKEQRKILETAYESNEKQLEIANQFLSVARLDSGQIRLNKTKVNLSELIKEAVKDQQKIASKKQQRIKAQLPKRPVFIEADGHYLPVVIDNLLSNASKYSRNGSQIEINLKKTAEEVVVSVCDKGIGMNEEDIDMVFDKFTRLEKDSASNVSGTGIGLYISKQIVDLHKGRIEVTSESGKGSSFTIHIPK